MYKRKTHDVWDLWTVRSGKKQVARTYSKMRDARAAMYEARALDPGAPYWIVMRRIKEENNDN